MNKNNKNKNKNKTAGKVGRKTKVVIWPTAKKFTVPDMVKANEGNCGKLRIIQELHKDAKLGKKSVVIKLEEKLENASGKGRKLEVYSLRSKTSAATPKHHTVKVVDIVPVTTTEQYEQMKAQLTAPEPTAVEVPTAPVAAVETPVAVTEVPAAPEVVPVVVPETPVAA